MVRRRNFEAKRRNEPNHRLALNRSSFTCTASNSCYAKPLWRKELKPEGRAKARTAQIPRDILYIFTYTRSNGKSSLETPCGAWSMSKSCKTQRRPWKDPKSSLGSSYHKSNNEGWCKIGDSSLANNREMGSR
ncbi:hypothetical protein HAX54_011001 [Datura stramonium]|uniref:Uncharacterized protein n=1 Tax=Datura stramonium TaxID=4076 RepID=A0ABS8TJ23_DATST|nr:hypothetical protein [Datura stramonium]